MPLPLATLQTSRQPAATSSMTVHQPPPAPNSLTATAPITSDRNSEARRAYRESHTAIALLQQRWPAAFPEAPQQVRPLTAGLTRSSRPLWTGAARTPALCCARGSCAPPIAAPSSTIPSALIWMATQRSNRSARTLVPWQRLASTPGPANAASPRRTSRPAVAARPPPHRHKPPIIANRLILPSPRRQAGAG